MEVFRGSTHEEDDEERNDDGINDEARYVWLVDATDTWVITICKITLGRWCFTTVDTMRTHI